MSIELVGQSFETNNCGILKIISYVNRHEVGIMFINTGYVTTITKQNIIKGEVKDKYHPHVLDIGYIGEDDTLKNNRKAYRTWYNMLTRCYDTRNHNKYPSYKDCSVAKEW